MDKYIMDGKDVIERYCKDYINKISIAHYDKCIAFIRQINKENAGEGFDIVSLVDMEMCPDSYGLDCKSLCDEKNYFYSYNGDFSLQRAQCTECWKNALEQQV